MAAPQKAPAAPVKAKRSHYVSMTNNGIYPAMTSPAGFEDEHPEDWRPASAEEIAKFKAGVETIHIEAVDLSPDEMDTPPEAALPHTLQLADEDPLVPPPAPVIPPGPGPGDVAVPVR